MKQKIIIFSLLMFVLIPFHLVIADASQNNLEIKVLDEILRDYDEYIDKDTKESIIELKTELEENQTRACGPAAQCSTGPKGLKGPKGPQGPRGPRGPRGEGEGAGPTGPTGPIGSQGITGATGATGISLLATYANFYALMPGDNTATIAVGAAVEFPQDGPISSGISRSTVSSFTLAAIGQYEVTWQVSVNETGQLDLWLDSGSGAVELPQTVVGRNTGTSQIVGSIVITTTAPNSVLSLRNASGNSTALTITPIAGGTHAVSATITIKQIA